MLSKSEGLILQTVPHGGNAGKREVACSYVHTCLVFWLLFNNILQRNILFIITKLVIDLGKHLYVF